MPALTALQKSLVSQFVQTTGATKDIAQRFLKSANWRLDVAADAQTMRLPIFRSSSSDRRSQKSQTQTQTPPSSISSSTDPEPNVVKKGFSDKITSKHLHPYQHQQKERDSPASSFASLSLSQSAQKDSTKDEDTASRGMFRSIRKKAKASKAKANQEEYFNNAPSGASNGATDAKLNQMFDGLRDPDNDGKDELGVESTMNYLMGLDLNPESGEIFVALELVQAPMVGEITRKGFVDGWKSSRVGASKQAHVQHMRNLVSKLSSDPAYFKQVYRYTFVCGKEKDQRALSAENAKIYWQLLFTSPPGRAWRTAKHDFLELWLEFLGQKWSRSVNRDMWNQVLEFANRTLEDETLGFWSEDSAWPSVIDDFVAWLRARGVGSGGAGGGGGKGAAGNGDMELDS